MYKAFRATPWTLYGLPESVPCRRLVSGIGYRGSHVAALELAHFSLEDSGDKQLRIEVVPAGDIRHDSDELMWTLREETISAPSNSETAGRQSPAAEEAGERARWVDSTILIEGRARSARKLRIQGKWVAVFEDGETSVRLTSLGWWEEELELEVVRDIEPYILEDIRFGAKVLGGAALKAE